MQFSWWPEGAIGALVVVCLLVFIFRGSRKSKSTESKTGPAAADQAVIPTPRQSQSRFSNAIASWIPLLKEKKRDADLWEPVLIQSDLGSRLTRRLMSAIQDRQEPPLEVMRSELVSLLEGADGRHEFHSHKPTVIMIAGVNGAGKTTTIAKLASMMLAESRSVGVIGADTFRKAAIEQLERSCQRVGCDFFSMKGDQASEGADPSSVIFDGLKRFADRDVVLIDTSGRLQNKKNLLEELKKMFRVSDKVISGSPHERWLVIDSTQGQHVLEQARVFHEAIQLTGLIFTKLDGLSRGGTIFQLYQELKIPILFLATGETMQDLERFSSKKFVQDLFDPEDLSS